MNKKLIIALILNFSATVTLAQTMTSSRSAYEEPTDYENLSYECHSEELGEESVIHGLAFSTYAERTIEVYPAAGGKYLIKDGLFDGNGSGIFTVDQKWTATLETQGSMQILKAEAEPTKTLVLPRDGRGAGTISFGFPQELKCTPNL